MKMDTKYLALMNKSGIKRLALGVESGSERILNMINKGITINQVLMTSKKLSKSEIPPIYSFMAGFPTETLKELKMTTNLIIKLLKHNKLAKSTILHCYRPLPGTELYELCVKKGLKEPTSLKEWGSYNMEKIDYPWISSEMQKKISNLNFLSLFLDKKYEEIDNNLVQVFAKLYQPLARYRFENYDFRFLIGPYLKKLFVNLQNTHKK